ncbi:hypothetical protein V1284_000773 [Nitrobacteraceae bacterium AZCC 2299]
MRFKLAILNLLAKHPARRLTLEEVRREVEMIPATGQTEQLKRFAALGDIDIIQSGLVLQDDDGLQITEAGLSLLHSFESPGTPPLEHSEPRPTDLPDVLKGTEGERLRAFDHNLALPDIDSQDDTHRRSARDEENSRFETKAPIVRREHINHVGGEDRGILKPNRLLAFITAKKQSIVDLWRRPLARKASVTIGRSERQIGIVRGAAFAVLSLVLVVACVVAAIAFGQIQSLRSDITVLRRELVLAKEAGRKARTNRKGKARPGPAGRGPEHLGEK